MSISILGHIVWPHHMKKNLSPPLLRKQKYFLFWSKESVCSEISVFLLIPLLFTPEITFMIKKEVHTEQGFFGRLKVKPGNKISILKPE